MSNHFMSILGTGLYEPVIYYNDNYKCDSKMEFVQFAVIDKYREMLSEPDSKITIFVTEKSKNSNYLDRKYIEKEMERVNSWYGDGIKEGDTKRGLRTQFEEIFPQLLDRFECVQVPNGESESEVWEMFDVIYNNIRDNDNIILDITHGFRSIPVLALSVVKYAQILKNCSVEMITYGAYEAMKKENEKLVPLFDLSSYNDIIDWSYAANTFMKYGNATILKEVFGKRFDRVPNDEKREWKGIKNIVETISILSDDIMTGRGIDGESLNMHIAENKKAKISIKNAYKYFVKMTEMESVTQLERIKPLGRLFEKIQENYKIFDKEENYEVGLAVVKWSINNNMIQQGFTALEESVKTFLCMYYNLNQSDETDRDKIAGISAIFVHNMYMHNNNCVDDIDTRAKAFDDAVHGTEDFKGLTEEQLGKCKEIVSTIPLKFARTLFNIKYARNDINHFGMNPQPKNAQSLSKQLQELYDKTIEQIEKMLAGEVEV